MKRCIWLIAFVTVFAAPHAFADREVVREESGIVVEEESTPGRTLPILTGTTTMSAPPEQIAAWIGATHTYVDWMYNCEEARVVTGKGGEVFGYNRIASPWPVSDRDVVLRSVRNDKPDGTIRIQFLSTNDVEVPVPRGAVRMAHLAGSYDLTPVEGGTHVIYTVDSDPGGSLPTWLIRQAGKDLPYFTLRNLRERAEKGPPPAA
jgi:hypothetical protein